MALPRRLRSLWLDLKDDYWDKQGRKSIDAVAIFGGLLGMGTAGSSAISELLPKLNVRRALKQQTRPE